MVTSPAFIQLQTITIISQDSQNFTPNIKSFFGILKKQLYLYLLENEKYSYKCTQLRHQYFTLFELLMRATLSRPYLSE